MEAVQQDRNFGAGGLKGYTRLVIAFFGGLLLLGVYQQVRLFADGVLDAVLGGNLVLIGIHHLGFAAVLALVFAFAFNRIESVRPQWGMRILGAVFVALLGAEYLLTEYFLLHFELAGPGFARHAGGPGLPRLWLLNLALALALLGGCFYLFYRWSHSVPQWMGRMYPFTIVVFALFLGTLLLEQRPVNQNKTQFLLWEYARQLTGEEPYTGKEHYPLWSDWNPEDVLGPYLHWPKSPPGIIMVLMEGLSSDFVGAEAPFRAFMPFADSLRASGLNWERYLANARTSEEALPMVTGSLHPGAREDIQNGRITNRHTLFSLLKHNGYRTSFQYGGNSSLPGWDRFLFQERTDEVADRKSFGKGYIPQREDAAGNTLGFPDHMLFDRYLKTRVQLENPTFDVFQTLSAKSPYLIPDAPRYQSRVDSLLEAHPFSSKEKRFVRKNREWMAAMLYADDCLKGFFRGLRGTRRYASTLIVLTGTHHPAGLPADNALKQYQVPLIITGPLVKSPRAFDDLASHLDLAPSLIGSLERRYALEIPGKAAWLGGRFAGQGRGRTEKAIPLSGPGGQLTDFLMGDFALMQRRTFRIGEHLELESDIPQGHSDTLGASFSRLKAINRYVIRENALIPPQASLYGPVVPPLDKRDLAWVHSVFPGTDYDRAYDLARELAHQGNWDRAALMCRFILDRVPGHIDTEILFGRIEAWSGDYDTAALILEQVVQKYPGYEDGYAALLDAYYWGGERDKALYLVPVIEAHLDGSEVLELKIQRAIGSGSSESHSTGGSKPLAVNKQGP